MVARQFGAFGSQSNHVETAKKLDIARQMLEKAYSMRPDIPNAATDMIKVCMLSGEGNPRMWFDRAIATEYESGACRAMLKALHPQYGGSYQAMIDFAREVVEIRYIYSHLPLVCLGVVRDIAGEMDNWQDAYKIDGVREMAIAYADAHLDALAKMSDRADYCSYSVAMLWAGGYLEDAYDLMNEIDWNLADRACSDMLRGNVASSNIIEELEQYEKNILQE